MWLRDLPDHPCVRLYNPTLVDDPDAGSGRSEADAILVVKRPMLTTAPTPELVLDEWLDRGWNDPFNVVSVKATRFVALANADGRIVAFEEAAERVAALESWRPIRDAWAEAERPAREAMKLFEKLYELHGQLARESERLELIIGDGILRWPLASGGIDHPLLLQQLQLEFDASVPAFRLTETEHRPDLYSALFLGAPDVDGKAIAACREELDAGGYHPLGQDDTTGFLRRLVLQLSPHGRVDPDGKGDRSDFPSIYRSPVLFLRHRSLGFATAIQGVLQDIERRTTFSTALTNIVGIENSSLADEGGHIVTRESAMEPEDVLLSKPANAEQVAIARTLDRYGAVLVQGPPGTGKTHTIANLIGHLLAKGASILVTAQTTKALGVLRDKVVEALKPLCVSVLGDDVASHHQLHGAVEAIIDRLSSSDARTNEAKAVQLHAQRQDLLSKIENARSALLDARTDEYRGIVVGDQATAPSEAARFVKQHEQVHGWIPGPLEPAAPLPLSEAQLVALYETNGILAPADEDDLAFSLPELETLLAPLDLEGLLARRLDLRDAVATDRPDLWKSNSATVADLHGLSTRFEVARKAVAIEPWKVALVSASVAGATAVQPWRNLVSQIQLVCQLATDTEEARLQHRPALAPDLPVEEQLVVLQEIVTHLQAGGQLGVIQRFTHPKWKSLLPTLRVRGRKPEHLDEFEALRRLAQLTADRTALCARWDAQMTPLGAPSSEDGQDNPEAYFLQFVPAIEGTLAWNRMVLEPLVADCQTFGFDWQRFLDEQTPVPGQHGHVHRIVAGLEYVVPVIACRVARLELESLERKFDALGEKLAAFQDHSPPVVTELRNAVRMGSSKTYRNAHVRLVELHHLREALATRQTALSQLERVAPAWAAAIRSRQGVHGAPHPPGDPRQAWTWLQFNEELTRRAQVSLPALQTRVEELSDHLRVTNAALIDALAWAAQTKRTTLKQRQSLLGWSQTVKRIGRGTGKRAPQLKAEASRLLTECRTAVPVWIMPLARVVDQFDPCETSFDVVIIDEASQSDVMALIALYLGKRVVIVGDDEQVSPTAVGQDLDTVSKLIDEHLYGVPNGHLYDGQMSVYKLAQSSFGGAICLKEHFRSVPEIIAFSNWLSYKGGIKALRPGGGPLQPPTVAIHVEGASETRKVNHREALTVASLLVASTEQPEYASATMGVISLKGDEQALAIDKLLRIHLPPTEYDRRRVLCGNAAQFQGDERDVMFLSMVDVPDEGPLSMRQAEMFKQRFNVAASRARDQMWVVHSVDPAIDLKPNDLRRRLIEHVRNPYAVEASVVRAAERAESEFERRVAERLIRAGYRVQMQWKVGHYRIDMVVDGGENRLAVECDGDRFHALEDLPADMDRQAILERLGWTFVRIRGSHFFRDPDDALVPVFEKLNKLGIVPCHEREDIESHPESSDPVRRILSRADALRAEWRLKAETGMDDAEQPTANEEVGIPS